MVGSTEPIVSVVLNIILRIETKWNEMRQQTKEEKRLTTSFKCSLAFASRSSRTYILTCSQLRPIRTTISDFKFQDWFRSNILFFSLHNFVLFLSFVFCSPSFCTFVYFVYFDFIPSRLFSVPFSHFGFSSNPLQSSNVMGYDGLLNCCWTQQHQRIKTRESNQLQPFTFYRFNILYNLIVIIRFHYDHYDS